MKFGTATPYYIDVKTPVVAAKAQQKLKKIGYEVVRLYFDSSEKDCQVGSERIKRVIKG
jgi:hypothetical protein